MACQFITVDYAAMLKQTVTLRNVCRPTIWPASLWTPLPGWT